MSFLRDWEISSEQIIITAAIIAVIMVTMLVLLIVTMAKLHGMQKRYKKFMDGKDGKNLEQAILEKFGRLDQLDEITEEIQRQLAKHGENLLKVYQKIGIVKYDAFKEVGGKMSFALALLTKENDGFVMNCMHSNREGCYTYVKEIVKGEAFVILSEEETQAVEEAKNNRSLIK